MAEAKEAKEAKGGAWKKHFLRSGVPLEYEVAKILAHHGMSINADHSYLRRDADIAKECSVDIVADWYGNNPDKWLFSSSAIIECKYRSREKILVLFEDPNEQFPPGVLGGTTEIIDEFWDFSAEPNCFVELESEMPIAYKMVEMHESGAHDQDFRHALNQIRYAIPSVLEKTMKFLFGNFRDLNYPIYISKIIVTNSDIRMIKSGTSLEDIEKADSLEVISDAVNCAIIYNDYGPDYEGHFRKAFFPVRDRLMESAHAIAKTLKSRGKIVSKHEEADRSLWSLCTAERYRLHGLATQFFVTNLTGLPKLIASLKQVALDNEARARA